MNDSLLKDMNYEIQLLYKKISSDDLDFSPEDYLIKKFDENFIFEIFFRQFFTTNKYEDSNVKKKLASELIDTIIFNKGCITLTEMVEIINYEEIKPHIESKINPTKFFDIEVNDVRMEIDSGYEAQINTINIKTEKSENIINIKESEDTDEQQHNFKKEKKHFFRRIN